MGYGDYPRRNTGQPEDDCHEGLPRWDAQGPVITANETVIQEEEAKPTFYGVDGQIQCRRRPLRILKELKRNYRIEKEKGIHRQKERVTISNGRNLGTLIAQLKKLRADNNRTMGGPVGKNMTMKHGCA
ncbi:LOW QUALITY PROTEIN: Gamma-aminobutyric acid receptor subunit epsilon-like [Phytophthora palmivora]|uniref:Gamma-aminobutyric acid receptor subunit epsilon-like n=1 Tax=Phytophthora palmivora TaxID=4796 RepID=A0A2P4YVH6_9STRA|nr:LOW QUALITY PROTEIN: Gamma-aminobutyric acid receptor subunit epsilon-like [Phytophthora palmivora]